MTADFRALCAELMDCDDGAIFGTDLVTRARAALAQPEPVPGAEVGEPSASDIEDYNKRATARFQQMDALERHIDFNQVGWNQTDAGIKWQRLMNEQGADEMSMGL
jgi:hypothetical protein